jgi:hypothetical protein
MEKPLTQPAAWPWRLPIIRHVRWLVAMYRVNRWYGMWQSFGYLENNNFDRRCIDQIRRGIV